VTLTAAAQAGGARILLASSNAAVTVPGFVSVSSGAMSAAFVATVASVNSSQTVMLTASDGVVSKNFALLLNAPSTRVSVNATSIAFGNILVNTTATQSVTLTSSGMIPVTVSSFSIVGKGFALSGGTFPVTLDPGQSITLNVQFDPTTTGVANGTVAVVSNSEINPTTVIALSGTGVAGYHEVDLSWIAPTSSPTPVVGYNVFRATSGSSLFEQLNDSLSADTAYIDSNVQSGQSYDYFIKSVDGAGMTSVPSNIATVVIP
jgi:hypothetical protein